MALSGQACGLTLSQAREPCSEYPPGLVQPDSWGSRAVCPGLWPHLTSVQLSKSLMPLSPALLSPCGWGRQRFLLGLFTASDRNPTQTDLTIKRTFMDLCGQKVQEDFASDMAREGLKPCWWQMSTIVYHAGCSWEHWQLSGVRHSHHVDVFLAGSQGNLAIHLGTLTMAQHL